MADQKGLVRPRDVEEAGIPREYLLRLHREGQLERIGRGLYALPGTHTSAFLSFAEISKRAPNAVICLISSLQFHELTTRIDHRVWIAIENRRWAPVFEYPPVKIIRLTGDCLTFDVGEHSIGRVTVKVYSPARTVADCFKFRSRVGLDVAIEALRETWRNRKATMDELWEAARVCRVSNVMRPYLEAIT